MNYRNHNWWCNDKSSWLEAEEKGDTTRHASVAQCSMVQKPSTSKPLLEPQAAWPWGCSAVPNVESRSWEFGSVTYLTWLHCFEAAKSWRPVCSVDCVLCTYVLCTCTMFCVKKMSLVWMYFTRPTSCHIFYSVFPTSFALEAKKALNTKPGISNRWARRNRWQCMPKVGMQCFVFLLHSTKLDIMTHHLKSLGFAIFLLFVCVGFLYRKVEQKTKNRE